MTGFSVQEVIEQAIQTEILGAKFYAHMAEKFNNNDEINTFFKILSNEEVQHTNIFRSIMEKTGSSYQMPDNWGEASKYLRAIVESEFFLGDGNFLPSNVKQLETLEDVLNYAITFEKVTLLYYLELRDIVGDKEAVHDIVNEEKKHVVWLSDLKKKLIS